jgi:hypothetical protein
MSGSSKSDHPVIPGYIPYRPFAFPQGDFFFENYLFVAYPHLNRLHFEINFAFRLLVRGVTGFNKACPHLLSARLRQFKKMADCTYPHPNGGLKSGKGEG